MENKKIRRIKKFFNKHSTIIILSLIFFSMLILNFLTPLYADDYNYKYIWNTTKEVENILDVFISQFNHYLTWGGRSVAHFIAQIFLIFPKYIFNIFNAFIYTSVVYIIYYLSTNNKKPFLLILIHFLLYFVTPYFGEDFLWLIGSCNYSWTLFIMLSFLAIYKKNSKKDNKISILLIFLLGILAGWTNENTAFGIIIITILTLLEEKFQKEKITKWKISGLIGLIIGFIILLVSPGNYARKALFDDGTSIMVVYIKRFITYTLDIKNIWPLLLLLLILFTYYAYKKKKIEISCFNYLLAAIVSLYAMLASPMFPARAWAGIVVFLIISIIMLLENVIHYDRLVKYITYDAVIILASIYLVDFYTLAYDLKGYSNVLAYRKNYIKEHPNQDTYTFEAYEIYNKKSPIHGKDLSEDKNNWLNTSQAKYLGVKYIIGK